MDIFEISQGIRQRAQLLCLVVTEGGKQLGIHFKFHYSGFLGISHPKTYSTSEVLSNCKYKRFYFGHYVRQTCLL